MLLQIQFSHLLDLCQELAKFPWLELHFPGMSQDGFCRTLL